MGGTVKPYKIRMRFYAGAAKAYQIMGGDKLHGGEGVGGADIVGVLCDFVCCVCPPCWLCVWFYFCLLFDVCLLLFGLPLFVVCLFLVCVGDGSPSCYVDLAILCMFCLLLGLFVVVVCWLVAVTRRVVGWWRFPAVLTVSCCV